MNVFRQLLINVAMSTVAFVLTYTYIPQVKYLFLKAKLFGIDQCKTSKKEIPESQGVVAGCVFLLFMFLFMFIPFLPSNDDKGGLLGNQWIFNIKDYHHEVFAQYLAALLSICCMLFLGFADDVLNLRWMPKLILPLFASLPLLMVYFITYNNTTIIIPKPFRSLFGFSLWLGPIYYIYMAMLSIFCTNAINIVAGINGIEAGQGAVISFSLICYNLIELFGDHWQAHLFSLHFMIPFFAVTFALLYHNWYPSDVFVGDTYCYFAGMTFAVVGILGHFSKTMLLFFIPQIFNFLYSCPQLFHFVECPRHRLPKYDKKSDELHPSTFKFNLKENNRIGLIIIKLFCFFKIATVKQVPDTPDTYECSNFTIINLILVLFGPTNEKTLTTRILVIQGLCSLLALFIRYGVSQLFY